MFRRKPTLESLADDIEAVRNIVREIADTLLAMSLESPLETTLTRTSAVPTMAMTTSDASSAVGARKDPVPYPLFAR